MPKKAATARSGAQRNRAKAQKSFEVVRQNAGNQEITENEFTGDSLVITPTRQEVDEVIGATPTDAPTSSEVEARPVRSARRTTQRSSVATPEIETKSEVAASVVETKSDVIAAPAPKGSASARLAARRGQRVQHRAAATLITAEHYTYVKRDLMIIAVLAAIMFIAIIVLYFTIGR